MFKHCQGHKGKQEGGKGRLHTSIHWNLLLQMKRREKGNLVTGAGRPLLYLSVF